jgi:Domain of unknown function (DUF4349)
MSRTGLWMMAVLTAACSRSGSETVNRPEAIALAADVAASEQPAMMAPKSSAGRGIVAADPAQAVPDGRMIVRSAEMTLQVSDVRKTVALIADATAASKGFLGASRMWRDGESDRASMTVRVPSATLDVTIARLRQLAVRVDNESVSGEDVTRQAVDLNAQLTNLRATESELRALLQTVRVRTQKASDVLEVHTELSRIRGEIDQHTAELQSLTQLAALSTITLDLRPDAMATPIATDAWQPRGVLHDALRALTGTARLAVNAVIWSVVYLAPLLLLAVGLLLGVRQLWARGRAQLRATPQR